LLIYKINFLGTGICASLRRIPFIGSAILSGGLQPASSRAVKTYKVLENLIGLSVAFLRAFAALRDIYLHLVQNPKIISFT
jgi:hypothetical protein